MFKTISKENKEIEFYQKLLELDERSVNLLYEWIEFTEGGMSKINEDKKIYSIKDLSKLLEAIKRYKKLFRIKQ